MMRLGRTEPASEVGSLSPGERVGVRGYGFKSRVPSPDLHRTMLRIARSKSTSPRRGEVDGSRGKADSIKTVLALSFFDKKEANHEGARGRRRPCRQGCADLRWRRGG